MPFRLIREDSSRESVFLVILPIYIYSLLYFIHADILFEIQLISITFTFLLFEL